MTNIPNLNIVVQQGDLVRDTQNIRNHGLDSSQSSALERLEKEDRKKTSVPEAEETEKLLLNKDLEREKAKKELQKKKKRARKKHSGSNKRSDDETGRLLDTIA